MAYSSITTIVMFSLLWIVNPVTAGGVIELYQDERKELSFELKDLDNRLHTLEEYRGKVVLVNFWASWCTPCIKEMPAMQRLSDIMDGRPLEIVAISVSERRNPVWRILQRLDVDFTILLDQDGETFNRWQARVLPTSYLIDAAGLIRYKAVGPLEWDGVEVISIIEKLMEEQP